MWEIDASMPVFAQTSFSFRSAVIAIQGQEHFACGFRDVGEDEHPTKGREGSDNIYE